MRTILLVLPLGFLAACGRELELPAPPAGGAAPLALDPAAGQVAPLGALTLAISGGVPPYALDSAELSSGTTGDRPAAANVDGEQLSYAAGPTGSVVDRLRVSDAAGALVEARISVGAALQVVPQVAAVPANGTLRFTVVGGQPPYAFAVTPESCEAECAWFDEATPGTYHASSTGTTDQVSISDANQARVEVEVSVGDPFEVVTTDVWLSPGGSAAIVVHGGSGRYEYELSDPAFEHVVRAKDGVVEVPAGAPALYGVDISGDPDLQVIVRDAGRPQTQQASVAIHIKPPVQAGATPAVRPGDTLELLATDGTPPYSFAFARHGNLSFGELSGSGAYRAGPNPEVLDLVEVTDAAGATALFQLEVGQLGLSAAAWAGIVERGAQATQQFPFVNGHLLGKGMHLRLGADGIPVALPMVRGRVHDVTDLNGDGLPDVIVGPEPDGVRRAELWAYVGTLDGGLAFAGGGVQGSTAVVADFGEAGLRVVLVGNDAAPCAFLTVPEFLRGDGPPCGEAQPQGSIYAVRSGDAGFAIVHQAAIDFFRAESVPAASPPVALSSLRGSCPLAGLAEVGPPLAADLDGNGRTEVAFLSREFGELHLCACRDDGNPPMLGLEALPRNGPLFLGPRRADGGASVVVDLEEVRRSFDVGAAGITDGAPVLDPDPARRFVGTGDVDGDGLTDLLIEDAYESLVFLLSDEAGGFAPRRRQQVGAATDWGRAHAAQLDPDVGVQELGLSDDVALVHGGHLRILAGTERGDHPLDPQRAELPRPALALEADSGPIGAVGILGTGDFLGDGGNGIAIFDNRLALQLFRVEGPGRLGEPVTLSLGEQLPSLDNLGKPLVARVGPGADSVVLPFRNPASGELAGLFVVTYDAASAAFVVKSTELLGAPAMQRPVLADLDGDGLVDLLCVDECTGPGGCPSPRPFVFFKGEAAASLTFGAPVSFGDAGPAVGFLLHDAIGGRAVQVALDGCDGAGCSAVMITAVTSSAAAAARTVPLPARTWRDQVTPRLFDDRGDGTTDLVVGTLGGFAVIPVDGGATSFVPAVAPDRLAVPIPLRRTDPTSGQPAPPDVGVVDLFESGSSSGVLRIFRRTAGGYEGQ